MAKEIKPKLILPNSGGGRAGGGKIQGILLFLVAFVFGVFVGMRVDDSHLGQTEVVNENDAQVVNPTKGTERNEMPYSNENQVVEESSVKEKSPDIEEEMPLEKKQLYGAKGLAADSVATVKGSDKNDMKESSEYTIQISAFKKLERAQKVVDELKQKGYDAYMVPTYNSKEENWNLIRIGKFKTKEEARNFVSLLKEKEGIRAVVKEFDYNPFKEVKD